MKITYHQAKVLDFAHNLGIARRVRKQNRTVKKHKLDGNRQRHIVIKQQQVVIKE